MDDKMEDDSFAWDIGVFDAHCHPTDIMASIEEVANMNARVLTIMASRSQDQDLVAEAAKAYPITRAYDLENTFSKHVVPAFGWHPWFTHQIYDDRNSTSHPVAMEHYRAVLYPVPDDEKFLNSLPTPLSLSAYLENTERQLDRFPLALVGEVGLDRAFRLPYGEFMPAGDIAAKTGGSKEQYTPGSREGRPLSPHRVHLDHQRLILKAQFELAGKMQRPVSVHSVQTHGAIFDLLQDLWKGYERPSKRERKRRQSAPKVHMNNNNKAHQVTTNGFRPFPPRICMHSYSGPPDALRQFLAPSVPADIYFSFSALINFSGVSEDKAISVIEALPDDRILVESDFHCAGERMDKLLKDIVIKVCEIRHWEVKKGIQQLKENYKRFVFG